MSKLPQKDVLNGIINREPLFIPFPQVWGESVRNCGKHLWKSVSNSLVIPCKCCKYLGVIMSS